CGKTFASQGNFERHVSSRHSDERPFSCGVCDKAFKTKQHLVQHSVVHREVVPYVCEVCGRGFTFAAAMREHQARMHSGVTPFDCGVCGKGFCSKIVRDAHMKVHDLRKQHFCEDCGEYFVTMSSLKTHKKKHRN